jgi:3-phenylpropionate/trans-cinnamate dioxygenase ferredoxin subunit
MADDKNWQIIGDSSQVAEGRGMAFFVNDIRIAVLRSEGKLYALDEMCTHAEASLAFGHIENGCVSCPWHYAQFSLETGEAISLPAVEGVQAYPVRETPDGKIEIQAVKAE